MFTTSLLVASMGLCIGGILVTTFILAVIIGSYKETARIEQEIKDAEKSLYSKPFKLE